MNKVSFAKTFIPKDKYQDVVYKNNRVLVHFSPKLEDDCVTCIECSVPIEGFTSEAVKNMYEAYVAEQQEKDLFFAKNNKFAEINEYDKSNEVNTFYLNEKPRWLDYEERSKIYEGNERLRSEGRVNTTLWIGTERFDSTIAAAQKLISQLEVYAKDCFNVTATHKRNVSALTSVNAILSYDYKTGYPEKLHLTL